MALLIYPKDKVANFTHTPNYMIFKSFTRRNDSQDGDEVDTIVLMTPNGLKATTNATWQGTKFGLGGALATALAYQNNYTDVLSESNVSSLAGGIGRGAIASTVANLSKATGASITGDDLQAVGEGVIANPYLTAVFNGVDLRTFSFTFDFFPRSSDECEMISNIISSFRKSSLPKKDDSSSYYLGYPDIFTIEHFWMDSPNKALPTYGKCVLQSVDVDYANLGMYASFVNGFPVQTQLTLQFTELNAEFNKVSSDVTSNTSSITQGVTDLYKDATDLVIDVYNNKVPTSVKDAASVIGDLLNPISTAQ